MQVELWAVAMVMIVVVVGSFGPIFLKKSAKDFNFNIRKLMTNHNLFFGVLCYAFGTILFIPALKGGELSVLYPMVSIGYICVSLYSVKFLKEKMNRYKWTGIVLIIIGVTFIGIGS